MVSSPLIVVVGMFALGVCEQSPEGSGQTRPTKLIVEPCRADWRFQHNVETAGVMARSANVDLPWLFSSGDKQIRNPEATQTGLGG